MVYKLSHATVNLVTVKLALKTKYNINESTTQNTFSKREKKNALNISKLSNFAIVTKWKVS